MRIGDKLPSLANVQAGSRATLNCPVGLTYDKITFRYSGVTLAQLEDIEVLINGKPVQTFADGEQLQNLNKYYGRPTKAGFLTLHFVRPEMTNLQTERVTGLGTADVQTLQINIDIDADATAPIIDAWALKSDPMPLGIITKVKSFTFAAATSGIFEIDNIPRGPKVLAAHFFKNNVNHIEVELNGRKITNAPKEMLEVWQEQAKPARTPQSDIATHIDYGMEGDLIQALSTSKGNQIAQDLRWRLDLGSAGSMTVLIEYIDSYAGL